MGALNIPLHDVTRARRGGTLNGTFMVNVVAVAVGLMEWCVSLTLGTALLIGAAIGPTDATAVSALGKGIPRGGLVVLRSESLINDGTALLLFALAIDFVRDPTGLSVGHAALNLLISLGGGLLVCVVLGGLIPLLTPRLKDPMVANIFRLEVPLNAFWLAVEIRASGVLAVVVTGLSTTPPARPSTAWPAPGHGS